MGLGSRISSIRAAQRRATVWDLAPHCTDPETAAFLHTSAEMVRKDRIAIGIPHYRTDHYQRPAV